MSEQLTFRAVIATAAALAGASAVGGCSTGRGEIVGGCTDRERPLAVASVPEDPNYDPSSDPVVLAEFVRQLEENESTPKDPRTGLAARYFNSDPADKVGELACSGEGGLMLNQAGREARALYRISQG